MADGDTRALAKSKQRTGRPGPIYITSYTLPGERWTPMAQRVANQLNADVVIRPAPSDCSAPSVEQCDKLFDENDIVMFCSPTWVQYIDDKRSRKAEPRASLLCLPVLRSDPALHDYGADSKPLHYLDIVVHRSNEARFQSFSDLRGARFVYNDCKSFSGYHSMRYFLARSKLSGDFFGSSRSSGGHLLSLQAIKQDEADCAAIDSQVLLWLQHHDSDLLSEFSVVESIGPFTTQPVLASHRTPQDTRDQLSAIFRGLHEGHSVVPKPIPLTDGSLLVQPQLQHTQYSRDPMHAVMPVDEKEEKSRQSQRRADDPHRPTLRMSGPGVLHHVSYERFAEPLNDYSDIREAMDLAQTIQL